MALDDARERREPHWHGDGLAASSLPTEVGL